MKYFLEFEGREVGAIGITYHHCIEVEAPSKAAALLKAYDTHEHLSNVWINSEKYPSPAKLEKEGE